MRCSDTVGDPAPAARRRVRPPAVEEVDEGATGLRPFECRGLTLTASYAVSFAAVQKHVAVLAGAGLVVKRSHGRERIVRLTAVLAEDV